MSYPLVTVSSPGASGAVSTVPLASSAPVLARPSRGAGDGPNPRRVITPGVVLGALGRRWRVATVLGLAAAVACGTAAWALRPDKYTASAVLRIAQSEQKVLRDEVRSSEGETYTRTQIALLRSRPVLLAALRDERTAQLPFVLNAADPVEALEKGLSVEPIPGTDLLRITLTSRSSGADLAPVVNAIIDAYLAATVRGDQSNQAAHLKSLQQAYESSEEKLRQLRESYQGLTRALKGGDNKILSRRQQVMIDEFASLKRELGAANTRDRDLELKIAGLRPQMVWVPVPLAQAAGLSFPTAAPGGAGEAAGPDADDPRLAPLDAAVTKFREQLRQFDAASADPNSPLRAEHEARLAAAEAAASAAREDGRRRAQARQAAVDAATAARVIREADAERAALRTQRAALQADIDKLREDLENMGVDSAALEMRRAEIERNEGFLRAIWEQKERAEVEQKGARQRVTVVARAEDATVANKYGRLQEAVGAGVGGSLVVLLGIAFADLRRNRIHTPTDVSRGLRLRVLAALPTLPTGTAAVRREPTNPGYGQFEAIDDLRTTLLTGPAPGPGGRVLLVTSALASEGKTTLATQLAASLARVGRRTLLVDGDLRAPSLHDWFGVDGGPGACAVLAGAATAEEAIRPTWVVDLDLLPAGAVSPSAEAALARPEAIRRVLDDLRARYDFVIVDTSPILLVPDALMVAEAVDGLLLSVRTGVSEAGEVYAAHERLSELNLPVLGVVVNGVCPRAAHYPTKDRSAAKAAQG